MKISIIKRIIPIALIAILASCGQFEEVRMGYPKTIKFTSEGGEINVSGDRRLTHFGISPDGKTMVDSLNNWIFENDWLTIKAVDDPEYDVSTSKFVFIAKPLTGKKKRTAMCYGYAAYNYTTIKVTQYPD